jgi:hypothetical protein
MAISMKIYLLQLEKHSKTLYGIEAYSNKAKYRQKAKSQLASNGGEEANGGRKP